MAYNSKLWNFQRVNSPFLVIHICDIPVHSPKMQRFISTRKTLHSFNCKVQGIPLLIPVLVLNTYIKRTTTSMVGCFTMRSPGASLGGLPPDLPQRSGALRRGHGLRSHGGDGSRNLQQRGEARIWAIQNRLVDGWDEWGLSHNYINIDSYLYIYIYLRIIYVYLSKLT